MSKSLGENISLRKLWEAFTIPSPGGTWECYPLISTLRWSGPTEKVMLKEGRECATWISGDLQE